MEKVFYWTGVSTDKRIQFRHEKDGPLWRRMFVNERMGKWKVFNTKPGDPFITARNFNAAGFKIEWHEWYEERPKEVTDESD